MIALQGWSIELGTVLCLRTAAAEKPTPPRWAAAGEVRWSAQGIAPVPTIRVHRLLLGQPTNPASCCWQNSIVSSLDLVPLCLLDYYFSLFLFHKAFEADGSAKGHLARNVFVIIKGTALCKWQGGGLEGENSFAVNVLQFAVVRCESVI